MSADSEIARMAARQYGLFTAAQARQAGLSTGALTRRRRAGIVLRIEPSVYRMTAAPVTWQQTVLGACLAERGWASHRTAAALWGLSGSRPGVVEVLVPRWRRRPNRSVRVHETRSFDETLDVAEVDAIPVTSVARTLVDIAVVLPRERVEDAVDDAIRKRLVTPEALWACVERLDVPGRPWVATTRAITAARLGIHGVPPNLFERRLFDVLTFAGLPLPAPQVDIRRGDGSLILRADWAYPDDRVILECDSEQWHGTWRRRQRDLRVDRELMALGYRVLRFTWEDTTTGQELLARDVAGALLAASA